MSIPGSVIALRYGNNWVALFFVITDYQNRDVGGVLGNKVLSPADTTSIYGKLGFVKLYE